MEENYTITSDRLGLRNWRDTDLPLLIEMGQDERVMHHFPSLLTPDDTAKMLGRFDEHFQEYGFTYFATEIRTTRELIGFVGMKHQDYDVDFCPHFDIGWRLSPKYWGQGYATEGAMACLAAKDRWQIPEIVSVASELNKPSWRVMERAGMSYVKNFDHPVFAEGHPMRDCRLYRYG